MAARKRLTTGLAVLALALSGCEQVRALAGDKPTAVAAPPPAAPAAEKDTPGKPKPAEGDAAHVATAGVPAGGDEYALPFAWESSAEEPLGRARAYLKQMTLDNADYMQRGAKFFPGYAEKESPRATVLACADARVQASAFDDSPENDDYTVRNLGNLVETTLGSLDYGVEHLDTPVLLIVGHTGCEAVKAAMDGGGALDPATRKELEALRLSKHGRTLGWRDAVIDNVHEQVKVALEHFGRRVHAGKLTVVGAVFDFRNELRKGAGKLVVVDVNGTHDEKRLEAFSRAIASGEGSMGHLARANALDDDIPTVSPKSAEELHDTLLQALASVPPERAAHGPPPRADKPPEPPNARHE